MMYNDYFKKIQVIANVKNFIHRFRIIISVVLLIIIGLSATYLLTKGNVVGTISVPSEIKYGDQLEFSANTLFSNGKYQFAEVGSDNWTETIPNRSGNYKIRVVSEGSFGTKYSDPVEFVIAPKEITVSVSTTSLSYGNIPNIICNDLIEGDSIVAATLGFTYKDLSSSNTEVAVIEDSVKIIDENGDDVTYCYKINNVYSPIEFTKFEATIRIDSDFVPQMEYDGTPFVIDKSDFIVDVLPNDETFEVEDIEIYDSNNQLVADAITPGKYTFKIKSYNFKNNEINTSLNYSTNSETLIGNFEILKRKVSYTTGSATQTYNDQFLKCDTIAISENSKSLVDGHRIVVDENNQAQIKYFGEIVNNTKPKILDNDNNDVTSFYEFEDNTYGVLSVEKKDINVTTNSISKVYDGKELSSELFTFDDKSLANSQDLFGINHDFPVARISNVGTIENTFSLFVYREGLSSEENILLNDSYNIIYSYGTLEITKKTITISLDPKGLTNAKTDSELIYYIYDGENHNYDNTIYSIEEIEKLYNNEEIITLNLLYNDSIDIPRNVDEYSVSIDSLSLNSLASQNYDVKFSTDKIIFKIIKRKIEIRADSFSWIYNKEDSTSENNQYDSGYKVYDNDIEISLFEDEYFEINSVKYYQNGIECNPLNAGLYNIYLAEVTPSELANNNYEYSIKEYDINDDFNQIAQLTINPRRIELRANNYEWIYDKQGSTNHLYPENQYSISDLDSENNDNYELAENESFKINSVQYYQNGIECNPLNAGLYNIYINEVESSELANNNYDYSIKEFNIDDDFNQIAQLTINQRRIELRANNYEWTYDKQDSTNHIYPDNSYSIIDLDSDSLEDYILAENESFNIKSVNYYNENELCNPINVGSYRIYIDTYDSSDLAKNNYNVTLYGIDNENKYLGETAKLSILKRPILLYSNDQEWTYDGLNQETHLYDCGYSIYDLYDNKDKYELRDDEYFEVISVEYYEELLPCNPFNAGIYTIYLNEINSSPSANNNYEYYLNNINSNHDIIDGKLTINQRHLKIKINDQENTYLNTNYSSIYSDYSYTIYDSSLDIDNGSSFIQEDEYIILSTEFYYYNYIKTGLNEAVNYLNVLPINAGTYEVGYDISNSNRSDLFDRNYVLDEITNGLFNIKQLEVILSSVDAELVYSAIEYSYDSTKYQITYELEGNTYSSNTLLGSDENLSITNCIYTYIIDGLGNDVTKEVTTPINAGTYEFIINTFEYSGTAQNNYIVTISDIPSKLVINRLDITLSSVDITTIYNANEFIYDSTKYQITYTLDGNTYSKNTLLGLDEDLRIIDTTYTYIANGLGNDVTKEVATPINAGTYEIIIDLFEYSGTAQNNYIVAISDIPSKLVINRLEIILSSVYAEAVYSATKYNYDSTKYQIIYELDGNIYSRNSLLVETEDLSITDCIYTYIIDGLDNNVTPEIVDPINAGTYEITIKTFEYLGTAQNNYIVTISDNPSKLVINRLDILLESLDFESTYNGKEYVYDSTKYQITYTLGDNTYNSNSLLGENEDISITDCIYTYIIDGLDNNLTPEIVAPINAGTYEIIINKFEYSGTAQNNYIVAISSTPSQLVINRLDILLSSIDVESVYQAIEYCYDSTKYQITYELDGNTYSRNTLLGLEEDLSIIATTYTYIADGLGNNVTREVLAPINAGTYEIIIDSFNYLGTAENNYIVTISDTPSQLIINRLDILLSSIDVESVYQATEFSYDSTKYQITYTLDENTYSRNNLLCENEDLRITDCIYTYIIDGLGNDITKEVTTPINAGTYEIIINTFEYLGTAQNNYIVTISDTPSQLVIDRLEVELTLLNDTVVYSGQVYNYNESSYKIDYELNGTKYSLNNELLCENDNIWISECIYNYYLNGLNEEVNVSLSSPINVGEYLIDEYSIVYDTNAINNYIINKSETKAVIKIKKLDISISASEEVNVIYNGEYFKYLNSYGYRVYSDNESLNNIEATSLLQADEYFTDIKINNEALINAGNYDIYITSVTGTDLLNNNYNLSISHELGKLIINKLDITVLPVDDEITYSNTKYVYDNSLFIISYNLYGTDYYINNSLLQSSETISIEVDYDNEPINSGKYTIYISNYSLNLLAENNYNVSTATSTLIINKLSIEIRPIDVEIVYNGSVYSYPSDSSFIVNSDNTLLNNKEVEHLLREDEYLRFNDLNFFNKIPLNVNNYKMNFILDNVSLSDAAKCNYIINISTIPATLNIKKKDIYVDINNSSMTYSGKEYQYKEEYILFDKNLNPFEFYQSNEKINSSNIIYSKDNEEILPINAGLYSMKLSKVSLNSLADNNYNVLIIDTIHSLEINKLEAILSLKNQTSIYDGKIYQYDNTYSLSIGKIKQANIESIESISVTYSDLDGNYINPIHSGTYKISYNSLNYIGPDNYIFTWDNKEKTLKINQKQVIANTTLENNEYTYRDELILLGNTEYINDIDVLIDGDAFIIESFSVYSDISCNDSTLISSLEALNVGTYFVKANLSLQSDISLINDYNIIINYDTLIINPKQIDYIISNNIELTYYNLNYNYSVIPSKSIESYEDGILCENNILSDGSTFSVLMYGDEELINVGTYLIDVYSAYSNNGNYQLNNITIDSIYLSINYYELNIILNDRKESEGIPYSDEGLNKDSIPNITHNFNTNITIDYDVIYKDINNNIVDNPISAGRYYYNLENITIKDISGNDIKSNFIINNINDGIIDIIHFEITISAVNQEYDYDGQSFDYPQSEKTLTGYSNIDVISGEIFFNHSIKLIVKYYIGDKEVKPIHAGEYRIKVVGYEWVIGNKEYYDVTIIDNNSILTINKVDYTIDLGEVQSVVYQGNNYNFSKNYQGISLFGTDKINFTVYNSIEMFDAGIYNLSVKDLVFTNGSNNDYSLIEIKAKYKINKAQIKIEIDSSEKDYDGQAFDFSLSNISIIDNQGFPVEIVGYSVNKDQTLMNSTTYKISIGINDFEVEGHKNTNFELKIEGGVYKINPLSIDIVIGNDEKVYTGEVLEYAGQITISREIYNNHILDFSVYYLQNDNTISPIHVGEYIVSSNKFKEFDENGNEIIYQNYIINLVQNGILKVKPYEAQIKAINYNLIYTGDSSLVQYNVDCELINKINDFDSFKANINYYQNGLLINNPTDVGEYQMVIDYDSIIVNNDINNNDYIFVVCDEYGVLKIEKLDIVITLQSLTKTYGDSISLKDNFIYNDSYNVKLYYYYEDVETNELYYSLPIHVGKYYIYCNYFEIYYNEIKLDSNNYNIIILNENNSTPILTIIPFEIEISPLSSTKIYDGQALDYSFNQELSTLYDTFSYTVFAYSNESLISSMIHAGQYIVKIDSESITISGNGYLSDYNIAFSDSTVEISAKSLTARFSFDEDSKTYDDISVKLPNVTITNNLEGDILSPVFSIIGNNISYDEIKYVVRNSSNKVVPYYVSVSSITIIDSLYDSLESDYVVEISDNRKYTINPINITVKTGSKSYYYCGIDLFYTEGFELISGELINGHKIRWDQKMPTIITKVGKEYNKVGCIIYDSNVESNYNRTINYNINTEYGILEVLPRPLYLETNTSIGTYNGQTKKYFDKTFIIIDDESYYEEFNITTYNYDINGNVIDIDNNYTFTIGGLLNENHIINVIKYTTVSLPSDGEIDNILLFTITSASENLTSCYEIHVTYGKISIVPLGIYIKLSDISGNEKIYDDIEINYQNCISFYSDLNYQNSIKFNGDKFDYDSLILSKDGIIMEEKIIKDSGEYEVSLTNPRFIYNNKDVTDCYNILGIDGVSNFTIRKKSIQVITGSNSKLWDGDDLVCLSYSLQISTTTTDLINTHLLKIDYENSNEEDYTLKCEYDSNGNIKESRKENIFYIKVLDQEGNNKTDNYEIIYSFGILEIKTKIINSYTNDYYEIAIYSGESLFTYSEDEYGKYVIAYHNNYYLYLYFDNIYYDSLYQDVCSVDEVVNVGEYYLKVKNDLTRIFLWRNDISSYSELTKEEVNNAIDGEINYTFNIIKRNLLIKPISKDFIYDGEEHYLESNEYEVVLDSYFGSSLPKDHRASIATDVVLDPNRITTKTVNITNVIIYNQNGIDVTDNFYIIHDSKTYRNYLNSVGVFSTSEINSYIREYTAKISLKKRNVSLYTNSATKVYDGAYLTCNNLETDFSYLGGLISGDELVFIDNGISIKNYGTSRNYAKYKIINKDGIVVTNCYQAYYGDTNENLGLLKITKREITIETVSITKVFDNKPLDTSDYQKIILNNELVAGDYIKMDAIIFLVSQTKTRYVGKYTNSINKQTLKIYDESNQVVTSNYSITYKFGIIEILESIV